VVEIPVKPSRRPAAVLAAVLAATAPWASPPLAGQPLPEAPPFPVSTGPVTALGPVRVAAGPGGEAVVAWVGDCPTLALCVRTFDAGGHTVAGPLALAVPVAALDEVPPVAMLAGGGFLVAWSRPGAGSSRQVVTRLFALDGGAIAPERVLATGSAQVFAAPDLAADPGGGAVAVWERRRFSGTGDGGVPIYVGVEIEGRRLDAAGAPLGAAFRVDGDSPDVVAAPAVAVEPGGGFLVAWQSFDFGLDGDDVLVRRFTPTGDGGAAPAGDEATAHGSATGEQTAPAVAATDQGTFLVAWQAVGAPGGASVAGQVFGPQGPLWPAPFRIGSGEGRQARPAAAGGDGAFGMAWQDERDGGSVGAQLRSAGGQPLTSEVRVDEPPAGLPEAPAVAILPGAGADAGLLVAWTVRQADFSRRVMARRYPGSGGAPEPCVPSATALCLGTAGRFRVTAQWATGDGGAGAGQVRPLTADTGSFWFFAADNLEVLVKVLDGCPVNQRFWVFAAGLTNVAVTLTVEDTLHGGSRLYPSPLGPPFEPVQDTSALPCP
jgi:hypothetical protein